MEANIKKKQSKKRNQHNDRRQRGDINRENRGTKGMKETDERRMGMSRN